MSYSTRLTPDPARDTVADTLADALAFIPARDGVLRAPPSLQSWPGIVHGGGVVALFDRAARALGGPAGPRRLEARLTSSIPIDTSLRVEGRVDTDAVRVTILEGGQALSAGAVAGFESDARARGAPWTGGGDGCPLPSSARCLACGALNPLGLKAQLRFDADGVWTRFEPGRRWSTEGALDPAVMPVVLDELAWWLGALVSKEGGLTNRIALEIHRPDTPAGPLIGAGRFDAVEPVDRRRAFWRTETALMSSDGALLATAAIVFRAGPEYSARQMEYFRLRTPPEIFRRMFPNHAI
jgi:hypothetical protein